MRWLRRTGELTGAVVLLAGSFVLASWAMLPLTKRSVHDSPPPSLRVLAYCPPHGISLESYGDLKDGAHACREQTYLIPADRAGALNHALAAQYTGYGGTWEFEILESSEARQYIHLTLSGDDTIIESWYWATASGVEPDQFRRLAPFVVLFYVFPLTGLFFGLGVAAYFLARKRLGRAPESRPPVPVDSATGGVL